MNQSGKGVWIQANQINNAKTAYGGNTYGSAYGCSPYGSANQTGQTYVYEDTVDMTDVEIQKVHLGVVCDLAGIDRRYVLVITVYFKNSEIKDDTLYFNIDDKMLTDFSIKNIANKIKDLFLMPIEDVPLYINDDICSKAANWRLNHILQKKLMEDIQNKPCASYISTDFGIISQPDWRAQII